MATVEDMSAPNNSLPQEFSRLSIRPSLTYVYPLFIFIHACVSLVGIIGNCAIIVHIVKRHLYKNPTFFFIANLALSDIIKAAIVVPLTVTNLLIKNFIFGSFLCYFLPMMHSFPIHASMLTYILVAVDRYRFIVYPMKTRVPAGLCTIGVWVVAVCVVLPYAVYINYVDLRPFGADMGLCIMNHDRDIEAYVRAMFIIFFCLPLAIVTFLYVKVSMELKSQNTSSVSVQIEDNANNLSDSTYHTHIMLSSHINEMKTDNEEASVSSSLQTQYIGERRQESDDIEDDLDTRKEKRTQQYLITMVVLYALCWVPINILILVTHFVLEDNNNSGRFDITFLTFTFFGFLSTCTNPVLYASWQMSDRSKDRLRGYFQLRSRSSGSVIGRFSNRNIENTNMTNERTDGNIYVNQKANNMIKLHMHDAFI